MTERQDALRDHSFADGMRLALAMAAQGAENKAHEIANRLSSEALRVIVRARAK